MENTNVIQKVSEEKVTENKKNQGVSNNVIQQAMQKLKKEAMAASGQNVPAIAIYSYLLHKCRNSEDFAKLVMVKGKTISKCFTYITNKAYELARVQNISVNTNNNTNIGCGMSSDEIFCLADEYFTLTDEEIEKRKEAERIKLEEARKAAEAIRKEARRKKEEEAKAKKNKAKKEEKSKDNQEEKNEYSQMSLAI